MSVCVGDWIHSYFLYQSMNGLFFNSIEQNKPNCVRLLKPRASGDELDPHGQLLWSSMPWVVYKWEIKVFAFLWWCDTPATNGNHYGNGNAAERTNRERNEPIYHPRYKTENVSNPQTLKNPSLQHPVIWCLPIFLHSSLNKPRRCADFQFSVYIFIYIENSIAKMQWQH